MTYAVTGSTGAFGTLAVRHLIALGVAPASIVALARDEAKAAGLKALGVQVRRADYNEPATLAAALKGVDRLLLVSGSEVGHRVAQHQAVIDAARTVGVKLVAYTSLAGLPASTNPLAPEHLATEKALAASGLPFVVLRNNWYTENYAGDLAGARATGVVRAAVVHGRVASASRTDYAEAAARVLTGEGHAGRAYELTGAEAWDYPTLVRTLGELLGQPVRLELITEAEKAADLVKVGLPAPLAGFLASFDPAIEAGTLKAVSGDLEKLLGRRPQSLREGLAALL